MSRKLPRRMTLPLIAACLVLADCNNNTSSTPGPTTAFAVMRFTTAGVLDPTKVVKTHWFSELGSDPPTNNTI